jgi:hypothetical protein
MVPEPAAQPSEMDELDVPVTFRFEGAPGTPEQPLVDTVTELELADSPTALYARTT